MMTMRNRIAALVVSLVLAGCAAEVRAAALPEQPQAAKSKATVAEYNAYQAAAAEKDPQAKVKLLDDFMTKYPTSEYLPYVYNDYWQAYAALKQWNKVIEYLDKILALPEIGTGGKLEAYYRRAATFEYAYNPKSPDLADGSTKARDAALEGLKIISAFPKPQQATDEQWATIKKTYTNQFYNTAASASYYLKDYKAAADNYAAALAMDPQQPFDDYRLGLAELGENPPEATAGFWALARAVDMKVPDGDKVTKYLHDRISEYQTPGCDSSADAEVNELLTLAQNSQGPPAGYSVPSAADLAKKRELEIPALIAALKAGGDGAKTTWLAVCNGVFPEAFLAKTYDVDASDPAAIHINAAVGTTEDEVNASTAADIALTIPAQPEAARLTKDDIFRFAGKLTGYTASPFQLKFDEVKINPEDIPAEKGKKAAKKPGKTNP